MRTFVAKQAYVRTVGAYRVSRLVPCLDLALPAILPMGTSSLQPCTETLFGIISHNYCLSRLFKECRTHCDGRLDLSPGSRIFDGTGVANIMQQWAL